MAKYTPEEKLAYVREWIDQNQPGPDGKRVRVASAKYAELKKIPKSTFKGWISKEVYGSIWDKLTKEEQGAVAKIRNSSASPEEKLAHVRAWMAENRDGRRLTALGYAESKDIDNATFCAWYSPTGKSSIWDKLTQVEKAELARITRPRKMPSPGAARFGDGFGASTAQHGWVPDQPKHEEASAFPAPVPPSYGWPEQAYSQSGPSYG
ncbi:hypothetical protein, partial [Streptomyces sp. WAC 01325]|uniref:hypothetical protein n=1 Tax=Streptomyces sp. WAC 01325 TaxID=2203202 RepID=UPI0011D09C08